MAENATNPGSQSPARGNEESTQSASRQEEVTRKSSASREDGGAGPGRAGSGQARGSEHKSDAGSAVAESLAQLEPKASPARPASKDVAASLNALAEGVGQAVHDEDSQAKKSKSARRPSAAKVTSAKAATGKATGAKATGAKTASGKSAATKAGSDQDRDTEAADSSGSKNQAKAAKADRGGLAQAPTFTPQFSSVEELPPATVPAIGMTALLFQEPDTSRIRTRKRGSSAQEAADDATGEMPARRVRTRKTAAERASAQQEPEQDTEDSKEESAQEATDESGTEPRRRRRGTRGRRKNGEAPAPTKPEAQSDEGEESDDEDAAATRRRRRRSRSADATASDEVTIPKGSTRLEAKRQRRKEGREAGRRRHSITESEYLARRESVKREMIVREQDGLNQIAVLEDDVLVEHYVARHTQVSMVGNVYLGRVQNVLPSMEAAFVDIGKGRNAVLYAGEVNWEAAGLEGKPRRIEQALKSGDVVLVQVTKDPIGHKGARLTAQVTLAGRHLVLVPSGAMTGISRKLPDRERQRLKRLLRELVPAEHGVIVRTAAEGASEEQLRADVERLTKTWQDIQAKAKNTKAAPMLLKGEPELAVRVVRDIFNEDFLSLKVQGKGAWQTISQYVEELSPELTERLVNWTDATDVFAKHRVDEQLAKAFDRKVWLPSGGTLIIDRTEAMTVIDVNTGKFTGSGGTLEETVTRNNLEAAEEIVRQLRLRDIGGIIVIDFIDMVLEANRDLVLRRLIECLGRDRTRHQVAEVTSLGLVQMTRKRVGQGLVEAFSTTCEACEGRGFITHTHPVERNDGSRDSGRRKNKGQAKAAPEARSEETPKREEVKAALNSIAAAAASKHGEGEQTGGRDRDGGGAQAGNGGQADAESASGVQGADGDQAADAAAGADGTQATTARGRGEAANASKAGQSAQAGRGSKARKDRRGGPPGADQDSGTFGQVQFSEADAQAGQAYGREEDEDKRAGAPVKARKRRVSSSGTIAPASSASTAILSFPAE